MTTVSIRGPINSFDQFPQNKCEAGPRSFKENYDRHMELLRINPQRVATPWPYVAVVMKVGRTLQFHDAVTWAKNNFNKIIRNECYIYTVSKDKSLRCIGQIADYQEIPFPLFVRILSLDASFTLVDPRTNNTDLKILAIMGDIQKWINRARILRIRSHVHQGNELLKQSTQEKRSSKRLSHLKSQSDKQFKNAVKWIERYRAINPSDQTHNAGLGMLYGRLQLTGSGCKKDVVSGLKMIAKSIVTHNKVNPVGVAAIASSLLYFSAQLSSSWIPAISIASICTSIGLGFAKKAIGYHFFPGFFRALVDIEQPLGITLFARGAWHLITSEGFTAPCAEIAAGCASLLAYHLDSNEFFDAEKQYSNEIVTVIG